jgi:hypothetical protein
MSISTIGDGYALRNAGDIVSHNGTAQDVVSVGADNYVIKANSSQTNGIQWVGLTSVPSQVFQLSGAAERSSMSGATSITISSIPQGYDDLLLIVAAGSTAGTVTSSIRFNSITTSSYACNTTRIAGGTSAVDSAQGTTSLTLIDNVLYAASDQLRPAELYFPNYSSTGGKSVIFFGAGGNDGGSGFFLNHGHGSIHSSALSTAITSVTITSTGTWRSGSGYVMYGIKR